MPTHLSLASSALLLALAMLLSPARAQTGPASTTIAFQGYLEDGGAPIADGSYAVTIGLFQSPTGGTVVYSETHTVTTTGGVFSLPIGGGTATSGIFEIESFRDALWVEVSVAETAMSPRTALQAAPYALSLLPGAFVQGDVGIRAEAEASEGFVYGLYGAATNPTGYTNGVYGLARSPTGTGLYGLADATTGFNAGVKGETASSDGRGVYGLASAANGASSGVRGEAVADDARGVYGEAPQYGVFGRGTRSAGFSYGVHGQSASSSGHGVYGRASSIVGNTYGVYGLSGSGSGRGVYGEVTRTAGFAYGVHGQSASSDGRGVFGDAASTTGTTYGVRGNAVSPNGYGTFGYNGASTGSAVGVRGSSLTSPDGIGVFGSGNAVGVLGSSGSSSGRGVTGNATALSGTTYGVYGSVSSSSGYAGYFTGGRGLFVENSGSSGITTATVRATNFSSSGGIAGWFESKGTDATLVVDQDGSGDIIRGFSSGNLRFRVENGGTVRADGSFIGGGADFAEWLPLASSTVAPGQLVGVTAGRVGLATDEAEHVMIVSSNPAFVGNPDAEDGGALVALVGQAEVRLASPATVGDLLVASGRSDGTARAVSPARYNPATDGTVAGRIIELVDDGTAVALVGVDEAAALRDVVVRQQDELAAQQRQLDAQQSQIDALVQRLDALDRQPNTPSAVPSPPQR